MFKFLSKYLPQTAFAVTVLLVLGVFTFGCQPQTTEPTISKGDNRAIRFFAGSEQQTEQQLQVQAGYQIKFPEDHASHPDYAVEWWYITSNLQDPSGKEYALQWTLFRFRASNTVTPWANEQQFMAHASLHTADAGWFEERFARGGVGNGGISSQPFEARLDNWHWLSLGKELFPSLLEFTIQDQVQVTLQLSTKGKVVLHGEQGYSQKLRASNQASYYYSQPHIDIAGTVKIANKSILLRGQGWFDHEWSSQYLDPETQGWDWFSMHLHNGDKLMLFNMRHQQQQPFWSGTLVKADGRQFHLEEEDIQAEVLKREHVAGRLLPLQWSVKLPKYGFELKIRPLKNDQWNAGMFAYYEGGIIISGSHSGRGFIELTGY